MSGLLGSLTGLLEGWGQWLTDKVMALINTWLPEEKRRELLEKLRDYSTKHPKVTGFLLMNTALSGFPLFLFILFGITVFTFSLIVGLIIGLVVAVLFTLSAIGVALMFVFPLIFFTTLTACFLFLLGLGAYWIFKKFNQTGTGAKGDALGDKLNSLTGGKLNFLMDEARTKDSEDRMGDSQKVWSRGVSGYYGDKAHEVHTDNSDDEKVPAKKKAAPKKEAEHEEPSNGTPKKHTPQDKATTSGSDAKSHQNSPANGVKKHATNGVNNATDQVSKAPGVNNVSGTVKGAPKKLNGATGTVKGVAGGTGLV